MNQQPEIELVSFHICPYVHRSLITLKEKGVKYKLTLIDLANTPDWFNKISPLGKVPVAIVKPQDAEKPTVLFESAVINEYVDEVTSPRYMPADPLARARLRGWIEVGSEVLKSFSERLFAGDAEAATTAETDFFDTLDQVEATLAGGNFFDGKSFTLVDAAFAPVFARLAHFPPLLKSSRWSALPKTKKWSESLVAMPSVRDSMHPEFQPLMKEVMVKYGSAYANELV